MNWIIRGIFQPTENRYWVGKRRHLINYLLRCVGIPIVFILAIVYSNWALAILGLVFAALSVIDYLLVDRVSDKLMWKHFYKRHYSYESPLESEEYETIKQFDKQPTSENVDQLKKIFKDE